MRVSIEEAIDLLKMGQVVAIPTETVYGLASWLYSEKGVESIFTLKSRPHKNPLIIHVQSQDECRKFLSIIPPDFDLLVQHFWPGPLTLVLPCNFSLIPEKARAGLQTAAFRMPSHPVTQKILQQVSPIVAPSANVSGKPSATRIEHVEHDFGVVFPVVDGGICDCGVESTILAFQQDRWHMARKGAISAEEISKILGYYPLEKDKGSEGNPICPGQMFRHYAPDAELILSKAPYEEAPVKIPYVLGYEDRVYSGALRVISLGKSTSCTEVANNLYDCLRQIDKDGLKSVWVDINVPCSGIWPTIIERLEKAASKTSAQS